MAITHITDGGDRAEMPSFRSLIRRSWWLIAPVTIIGLVGGAAYSKAKGDSLESTVQVQVTPTVDNQLAGVRSGQLVNLDTESVEVRSDALLTTFAKTIGSNAGPTQMRKHVTVAAVPGSLVLKITYSASSARAATTDVVKLVQVYLAHRHAIASAEVTGELKAITPQIARAQADITTLVTEIAPLKPSGKGPNSGPAADLKRQQLNAQLNAAEAQLTQLQARQNQLKRVEITPGKVESGPSPAKSTRPPKSLTLAAGGLAGLFVGFALAALQERFADARPPRRLARRTGAPTIVTFDGAKHASADLQNVMVCLDPKLGSIVATTAIGRASSSKLAADLALLSARAGNSTLVVFTSSPPEGSITGPVVAAPLSAEDAVAAAVPVDGVDRLSSFVVGRDDPALLGDAFTAALSALARSKDFIVIVDAPPLKSASTGQVIARHADSTVIVVDRRLSRRALQDASLLDGLRARVVVVDT